LLFAFLGGLILNLMPCVFPVLSMKAASLAGHAHDAGQDPASGPGVPAGRRRDLPGPGRPVLAVRAGGAAVGWGFQLQSPQVIAGLALVMLLVALNMSGVFEIGTSVQNVGARRLVPGRRDRLLLHRRCWPWSSPPPAPRRSWPARWATP
jgi:thiol:disulfide interchange protein